MTSLTASAANLGPRRQPSRPGEPKIFGVYTSALLTTKVFLKITEIGKNVKQNLEGRIVAKMERKCIADGYVKSNSVQIVSYSAGRIAGDLIEFTVVFECKICHPVEGMLIDVMTKTITKAGIHAEVEDEDGNVPITIFIARDHHHLDPYFNTIKEKAAVKVKVIGVRYELNDPYISVIAKLMEPRRQHEPPGGRYSGGERITISHAENSENITFQEDDFDE